jgi:hypothetical protein
MSASLGRALRMASGGRSRAWVPCPAPAEVLRMDKGTVHVWMVCLQSLTASGRVNSDDDMLKVLSGREASRARSISQALVGA